MYSHNREELARKIQEETLPIEIIANVTCYACRQEGATNRISLLDPPCTETYALHDGCYERARKHGYFDQIN